MLGKFRPFVDGHPCVDEYADETGLIIKGWMLVGIELDRRMLGLILFNQSAGIWRDPMVGERPYFDSVRPLSLLKYVLRLALVVGLLVAVLW